MDETWQQISGYEGKYEVSNLGRVKGVDRIVTSGGRVMRLPGKLLAPRCSGKGYLRVALSDGGKAKDFKIHRLVAVAFLPPTEILDVQVNHIDSDKSNNNVSNLEWCSNADNMKHAIAAGAFTATYLARQKLSPAEVVEIRRRAAAKESTLATLAHEFMADASTISRLVGGLLYRNVPAPVVAPTLPAPRQPQADRN